MLDPVHVVIAPDSFKGSLSADRVADALAEGLRRVRPDVETVLRPIADGGEGTVAAALRAGYRPRTVRVSGPDGRPVEATLALRRDDGRGRAGDGRGPEHARTAGPDDRHDLRRR